MSKIKPKTLATSLTAVAFLIVGITGLMLFLHIGKSYAKELHELLGIGFTIFAIAHIIFNWTLMKRYFSNKLFYISLLPVVVFSLFISMDSSTSSINPKDMLIKSTLNAPLQASLSVLQIEPQEAMQLIENAGLSTSGSESLMSLANNNNISPFKLVQILSNRGQE